MNAKANPRLQAYEISRQMVRLCGQLRDVVSDAQSSGPDSPTEQWFRDIERRLRDINDHLTSCTE